MDVNNLSGATHRLHNTVYARLEAIANAEKITRAELGNLSREALIYVTDTQDIEFINRLLGVLTPVNKKVAILYFGHFLPWDKEVDKEGVFQRFGKKHKGEKAIAKKMNDLIKWLEEASNNIWTWAEDNVELKPKDLVKGLTGAFERAFKGDDKSNTPALPALEVVKISLKALFSHGITIDEMLAAITAKEEADKGVLAAIYGVDPSTVTKQDMAA